MTIIIVLFLFAVLVAAVALYAFFWKGYRWQLIIFLVAAPIPFMYVIKGEEAKQLLYAGVWLCCVLLFLCYVRWHREGWEITRARILAEVARVNKQLDEEEMGKKP